jgi:hypothetical protein
MIGEYIKTWQQVEVALLETTAMRGIVELSVINSNMLHLEYKSKGLPIYRLNWWSAL